MAKAAVARKDDDDISLNPQRVFGAAMQALSSDKQRLFVMYWVLTGNNAEACRRAGFGTPETDAGGFARMGWHLSQNPRIQAAVVEEAKRWFRSAAPAAVAVYHEVMADPEAKHADKLRAADAVMARVDPIVLAQVVKVEHEHNHRHSLSADEITAKILQLAAKVGVDVKSLPQIIDAVAEPDGETLQ